MLVYVPHSWRPSTCLAGSTAKKMYLQNEFDGGLVRKSPCMNVNWIPKMPDIIALVTCFVRSMCQGVGCRGPGGQV